ncbi:response regulator transcription factor [Micromonospora sp. HUAS LYJ1]|uniref:helix-turn-helix transcriptional regulator n=1 Tax=Micromonospora sp. HUAS LYJ1 TaxID=3061626 RepID=UPI00267272C9|nr:response regulator transcription factor [Micromonospora sp. HUAS LYJ1]WKU05351.1 response regulator transcription factor [Micromonospora sp. HUAS LYJ1]
MDEVRVIVQAPDPVTHTGLVSSLVSHPGIEVVPADGLSEANVVVLCCEELTQAEFAVLRRSVNSTSLPVVLVVGVLSEADFLAALECRVVAVIPRGVATAERLRQAVLTAATGGGVLPPSLIGEVLKHLDRLQREVLIPYGLNSAGLNTRELDVLRLMADGLDTQEIAERLSYSERTVKNVIHGVTGRLNLRNRSHAVAYAVRTGLI